MHPCAINFNMILVHCALCRVSYYQWPMAPGHEIFHAWTVGFGSGFVGYMNGTILCCRHNNPCYPWWHDKGSWRHFNFCFVEFILKNIDIYAFSIMYGLWDRTESCNPTWKEIMASTLELLQPCTKPTIPYLLSGWWHKSQHISSHFITQLYCNIPVSASEELKLWVESSSHFY